MRAVITGATSGIGRELAKELSKRGWSLILTGRNQRELEHLQKILPTETDIITLDLAKKGSAQELYRRCQGRGVDMLINNAGFGVFGRFTEVDLQKEMDLIVVNIVAVHTLTKLFLRDFERQRSGRILNVASSAGFLSGPLMASYYASKNYVVRLSLAIREELRRKKSPVTISVLCPGPVDTDFSRRAGVQFSVPPVSAKETAVYALEGTLRGTTILVPGVLMKLSLFAARFVPHKMLAALTYEIQKKKLPKEEKHPFHKR